ncbi:MAG TPA: TetR/AcrR family transcriptional regulator [Rhizomicrobium sp.]|nr:TetR/AcrR family transcriptional regulator [Rhizomicrobium sp.]
MDTQDRIFKAARRLFDEKGLEGVSLRNVAKKIGITPMAIYRHFADKQALIDALVLDGLAEWSARVEALPPAKGLAKIEQIGEAYLDFALKAPRRFEAAFLLPSTKARRYPDDFVAGRSPAGNVSMKILEEAAAQGLIKDVAPIEIMITNAALSQGLISLYRAGRVAGGEREFRDLYRRAMRRSTLSFLKEKTR